jgi:hypothetical protein
MTDYRTAAVTTVLVKEVRSLLVDPSHDNATRCVELMDRLREHDDAAFNECLRQEDDPKLKAMATFVAGIPKRAERLHASLTRSSKPVEPEPPPVQRAPPPTQRSTYADHADFYATEDRGGRYARMNEFIAPGEIPQYPRQPSTSPWFRDPVPDEPPTGYDINLMPGQEPKVSEPGPTRDELIQEIARLRQALEETQSGAAAPVRSAVADATPTGGEQVEVLGRPPPIFHQHNRRSEPQWHAVKRYAGRWLATRRR